MMTNRWMKSGRTHWVLSLAGVWLMMCVTVSSVYGEHWANWRGPQLSGATTEKNLPVQFSKTERVKWSIDLPGIGASTPVIWGDRLFVSATDPAQEALLGMCIDRTTGKILWQKQIAKGYRKDSRSNYASPSPVTNGQIVVFFFGTGDLAAYQMDGSPLWEKNLPKLYGDLWTQWTFSSSPLLVKDRLYLQVLHRDVPVRRHQVEGPANPVVADGSYLLAFEARSGQKIWQVKRPDQARVESKEAYTTPLLIEQDGQQQIVIAGADCLTGHSAETGQELWRWSTWNPRRIGSWRLIVSPVAGKETILVCGPKRASVFAVKRGGQGALAEGDVRWSYGNQERITTDVPTPAFAEGSYYVMADIARPALSRVEEKSGKILWTIDLPRDYLWRASPTYGDGKLYCMDHHGTVLVINAADGKLLHQAAMGGDDDDGIRSTIVISQGQLFIRTHQKLWCIE